MKKPWIYDQVLFVLLATVLRYQNIIRKACKYFDLYQ